MKQSLRFFSLGLLVSSLILLGYSFISDEASKKELSVDEMINALGEEGYRVVSEDEFITFTLEKDRAEDADKVVAADQQPKEKEAEKSSDKNVKEKEEKAEKQEKKEKEEKKSEATSEDKKDKKDKKETKEKKEKDKKPKVVKTTIKISSGVVTQEIADDLVDKGIIKKKEGDKFVKYLDDNNFSGYIQLGTFKVSSDMDFNELAKILTTYPGN